jgi:Xaa-Pro aminopeptidase
MIHSNEPGYYAAGKFGIRLENLQVVQPVQIAGAEKVMLGFEILTLAPFDRDAIAASLLTAREADWLNAYHERVRRELTPLVDETTARWLQEATAPIAAGAPA